MSSDPWLPAGEEQAEIGWFCGLLNEVVDLPKHTKLHTILNSIQLLL